MNRKIGNDEQICTVMRSMITEGRGNGSRIITVANGKLHFILTESNALDILRLWHEGVNMGFVSKNGLYAPNEDFLHRFPAGMLYTCGLDAIGAVEGHFPHGRIHSVPAEIREIRADEKGVKIVAEIRDTALFGANMVMTRTIETAAMSDEITLTDVIENRAFRDEDYCLLYHINLGYPLVDEGAKIGGKFTESFARTDWAKKCIGKMLEVEAPADNMEENCFFHKTEDGVISLTNKKLGKCFSVKSTMKKFVEWKSRASGDYVIGLEPCSCWLDGNLKYNRLKSGAKVTVKTTLSIKDV